MLSTKGIVATASIEAKVTTCAGVVAVVDSAITNTVSGFSKIKEGIKKDSPSTFLDGILQLRRAYSTTEDLLNDFYSYVDQSENDFTVRETLKQGAEELKSYIQVEIEDSCVVLLSELEDFFVKRNTTLQRYNDSINQIYHLYLDGCSGYNYIYVLGQAGKIYDEIMRLNISFGLWTDYYRYDHYLAYCIAGWIKNNLSHCIADRKTQKEVAADITDNIFKYIKGV